MADDANDTTMAQVIHTMNLNSHDDYKEVIGEIKRLHEYFKTVWVDLLGTGQMAHMFYNLGQREVEII